MAHLVTSAEYIKMQPVHPQHVLEHERFLLKVLMKGPVEVIPPVHHYTLECYYHTPPCPPSANYHNTMAAASCT